jgi:high affinity choline transporter 7
MQYMCPTAITFFGLGAVSAAVMSSADSSVLSVSSMFARNVYKLIFRQKASERELVWVIRGGIFVVGVVASVIGISVESTFQLWFLAGDLVYVVLFPQLIAVLYIQASNTYGSFAGFIIGFLFRLLGGLDTLRIPAAIHFPGYIPASSYVDETTGEIISTGELQRFPFKTMTMLLSLGTIVVVSYATNYVFKRSLLPRNWDIFHCVVNIPGGWKIPADRITSLTEPLRVGVVDIKKENETMKSGSDAAAALSRDQSERADWLLTEVDQKVDK